MDADELEQITSLLDTADNEARDLITLLHGNALDREDANGRISALSQRYQAILSAAILLEQRRRAPPTPLWRQQRAELAALE